MWARNLWVLVMILATAFALPSPVTRNATSRAALKTGGVRVMRDFGGFGESVTGATISWYSERRVWDGKSEAVWPGGAKHGQKAAFNAGHLDNNMKRKTLSR
jgi:hypothetical protein